MAEKNHFHETHKLPTEKVTSVGTLLSLVPACVLSTTFRARVAFDRFLRLRQQSTRAMANQNATSHLRQSGRHVPPEPIRTLESSSRVGGQKRPILGTQARIRPEHDRQLATPCRSLYFT